MLTSCFKVYKGPGAVSIARHGPRFQKVTSYRQLAPGAWFNKVDHREYIRRYQQILDQLDPQLVHDDLVALAAPHVPVLLCWEVPPLSTRDDWFKGPPEQDSEHDLSNVCHRRYVAVWFKDKLGIEVPEWDHKARPNPAQAMFAL